MIKNITTIGLMVLLAWPPTIAVSEEKPRNQSKGDAKELSGISIVGNKEAPKSLFIVPWKGTELGIETGLASIPVSYTHLTLPTNNNACRSRWSAEQ